MVLALVPAPAAAQDAVRDPRSAEERLFYFFADEGGRPAAPLQTDPALLANPLQTSQFAFVYFALPPQAISNTYKAFLRLAERARVDQQLGAPALGGSAGAASRTGLASVLAVALETGAVTQTVDQNLMTLRANADGLVRFLSNQEIFTPCPGDPGDGCRASGFLRNLELAASFNVSESETRTLAGTVPGTGEEAAFAASVSTKELRGVTARYAVYNSRDLRSAEYRERWVRWLQQNSNALRAPGSELMRLSAALVEPVMTAAPPNAASPTATHYSVWRAEADKALKAVRASPAATDADVLRVYGEQLDLLVARMRALDPEFDVKLQRLGDAYARYLSLRRSLASALVTDPALTIEYAYAQPALEPRLHTVRVAFAYSPKRSDGGSNPGTFTMNAGFGYYHDPQPTGSGPDTGRWRDVHLAAQFDRPLGPPDSAATLSIGAYYQYQKHPHVIEIPAGATTLPGTSVPLPPAGAKLLGEAGSLVVGQALLTIRIPGSGLRMPLGVSWSNRTELTSGTDVRGHIGFTFDPAALFLMAGGT